MRRLFGTEPFTRQIYFVTLVFLPGKSTIETAESLRSFSDICAWRLLVTPLERDLRIASIQADRTSAQARRRGPGGET